MVGRSQEFQEFLANSTYAILHPIMTEHLELCLAIYQKTKVMINELNIPKLKFNAVASSLALKIIKH
jgi:hypothetical protein